VLLRNGQEKWRLSGVELSRPPQAGAAGTATEPVATEIAQQVRKHIRMSCMEGGKRISGIAEEDVVFLPQTSLGAGDEQHRSGPRSLRSKDDKVATWAQFMVLAGLPPDGPLLKLSSYVRGPFAIPQGRVLLYKDEAPGTVFFIASGLVNLWNEGRNHEQAASMEVSARPTIVVDHHCTMLAKGTSRMLRVGPGWVLGGSLNTVSGLSDSLVPLTSMAHTQLEVFQLAKEEVRQLQTEDPDLKHNMDGLLFHFSALLVQHMAMQLSDWHSMLYAARASSQAEGPV